MLPASKFHVPGQGRQAAQGPKDLECRNAGCADSTSPDGSSHQCLCTQTSLVLLQSHLTRPFLLNHVQEQPKSASPSFHSCAGKAGRAYSAVLEPTCPCAHLGWIFVRQGKLQAPRLPCFLGSALKQVAIQAQQTLASRGSTGGMGTAPRSMC